MNLMAEITARGNIPLLTGGTMLYFKALREGLSDLPSSDPDVRAMLDAEIAEHGIKQLHARLAVVDPETAARLKSGDTQRVQRAMEIYLLSGKPMSELIANKRVDGFPWRIIPIALVPSDRALLHARIATRFKTMLEHGLVGELRALRKKYPLHPDMTSMRCVGYRQAWDYLDGKISETELLDKGIVATRQLAKRQLTWLRSMPDNIELDCLSAGLGRKILDIFSGYKD